MQKKPVTNPWLAAVICFLLIVILTLNGCTGRSGRSRKKPKPARFTAEELAEGFIVTRLQGSVVVKMADGIELEPPPYEFFLTVTNPTDQPKQLAFVSMDIADLVVKCGDELVYRYSKEQPSTTIPEPAIIRPKGKKSWLLRWDGKVNRDKQLKTGVYTLIFTLNTEPVYSTIFQGITLKFPLEVEPSQEEPSEPAS